MASTVCFDFDTAAIFANRAALSLASPIASPQVPATPTNTPASVSPLGSRTGTPICFPLPPTPTPTPIPTTTSTTTPTTRSPLPNSSSPVLRVPMNTPVGNPDRGVASPIEAKPLGAVLSFLETHHFPSPLLSPRVPPNSPECWPFIMGAEGNAVDVPEEMHASLGERLAALSSAASKTNGFTDDEVRILKVVVPKAPDNEYYEIRAIPGKGYGCFARKPIKRGTRILADSPLLIVPMAEYYQSDIQAAFDKLSPTDQALYFSLYSAHAQDPANWPRQVHTSVAAWENQRIREQHNARVAKEPSLISIFQTNCMEMDKGAAVFPNAARFNHSCNPNACFTWNPAIGKETIHVMNEVKKDDQITLAYCDMTHDKALRRWELKHYGFSCDCPACDDDSDPTSFASQSAARRYRLMELQNETKRFRGRNLDKGAEKVGFMEQLLELAKLHIEEGNYSAPLANIYLDIALVCEQRGDLRNAKMAAQKALQVKLDCQGSDFPDYGKYAGVVDRIKKKVAMQGKGK